MPPRDLDLAIEQLIAAIHRQLVSCPPGNEQPVGGLTAAHLSNLARTIASCLDEYGRREEDDNV